MKKYIVWTRNGCEGWTPTDYNTLEEALKHEGYGMEKIITIEVKYKIVEKKEIKRKTNKKVEDDYEDMWCGENLKDYHNTCGYNNGVCSTCDYPGGCNI